MRSFEFLLLFFVYAVWRGDAQVTEPNATLSTRPELGLVECFAVFGGGAGVTNQGISTQIMGDLGTTAADTLVTGFHDHFGCVYTETTLNVGAVSSIIDTAPGTPLACGQEADAETFARATAVAADAQTLWDDLSPGLLPGGSDPGAGQLGGLTLAAGIYEAAGGSFLLTGSDLTLDAQGNASALWVFQAASSLTVGAAGAPRSVILINGAEAGNVFWWVGAAATINAAGGGVMVGTIVSSAGVTFSTSGNAVLTVLDGRAIALHASVTMVNTVITVPPPFTELANCSFQVTNFTFPPPSSSSSSSSSTGLASSSTGLNHSSSTGQNHSSSSGAAGSACASTPCLNGANCTADNDTFVCVCVTGFLGTVCSEIESSAALALWIIIVFPIIGAILLAMLVAWCIRWRRSVQCRDKGADFIAATQAKNLRIIDSL